MPTFVIRDSAQQALRGCAACMEYNGPLVDLGVYSTEHGEVYLCLPIPGVRAGCFGQIMGMLEYPLPEQVEERVNELAAELAEAKAQNAELKEKIRAKEFTVSGEELRKMIEA